MVVTLKADAYCLGVTSRLWYGAMRWLGTKEVSLRELRGKRHKQATVIAVGGNSVGEMMLPTIQNILKFRAPVLTHGNGPQVGRLLLARPDLTFDQCVLQTQYDIGGELKAELEAAAAKIGRQITVEVIPTRVIVDPNDPAFENPTKPIGIFYSVDEMRALGQVETVKEGLFKITRANGETWHVAFRRDAKDPTKPFRRVVASPKPLAIHPEDLAKIKAGTAKPNNIVIACGGGGVPGYLDASGRFIPLAGVIDKDLASAVLSNELQVREMIISTKDRPTLGFNTKAQRTIDYAMLKPALSVLLKREEFPTGSMGEKIEAAINALRGGANVVEITSPDLDWIQFEGTLFTRGWDITGRMRDLGIKLGNLAQKWFGTRLWMPKDEIQRWLVA